MTATVSGPRTERSPARGRTPADGYHGLGAMIRLVLRRNRVRLIVWVVVLVGMYQYIVSYYKTVFPDQRALDAFATLSNTPGIKALTGLSPAASTMGGAVWTKGWMTVVLALAIGVVFLVTRTGRADEEAGRTELLRSRVLGVHAYSMAAWLVTGALCVVIGVLLAVVSIGGSLDPAGTGITGSLILGGSVAGIGLVGLGVGAVAGQVSTTSRGANSLGAGVIIAAYVFRMIGDMGNGVLSWFSPIGWGQQMQPYGGNRWWPLLLLLGLTAVLLVAASQLEARRDIGAGLLPQRPGRAGAPARYGTPFGLALRLQRNPIIGWTIAIVLGGALMGSVVEAMTDLLADAGPGAENLLRGTGVTALLALLVSMMALITVVFALQTTVSLRADEASGIIEPQLAGALSRRRWALERLAIPTVWSAVLLALGGFVIGEVYGAAIHDSTQGGRLALAALAYWPAVMVFVGLAVLLWGYLPRVATPIAWGVMAAMWFITMFGEVFRLPQWFLDLLPLSATPYAPLEPMAWAPLGIMTLVALALTWIGLDRFARRDIQPA
ncbi:ABC transporter permease [Nakamurella multipartita]|jgi:ABC-2 type transport system permease protein|uniref:Exporter of polyketide antibiotics-like protein n=1 Tax=Nakamurella multipartita (strain ATCC 700099 / DSM 44233 / CIP 104796 / JCM 9543 / NBRC 105858 / Y-104) TaxID=479431 RepID=C8XGG3_NAKMY|nr:ABC transporter permease [Nakamurella multipartita]ACV78146.1 Putative exporter of polyketide antibiotics- like protein [Nakamurella multipartita DSM 44233]